jgi:hypothetical protein
VDPRELLLYGLCTVVLLELGVSKVFWDLALLGVDFVIVGLLPSTVTGGTVISEGVIASAHGLLDDSGIELLDVTDFPVLLSLLRSRILFGSPLTARARLRPELLDPELDSAVAVETTLEVSISSTLFGERPRLGVFSSTHPAGVGGTGPSEDTV